MAKRMKKKELEALDERGIYTFAEASLFAHREIRINKFGGMEYSGAHGKPAGISNEVKARGPVGSPKPRVNDKGGRKSPAPGAAVAGAAPKTCAHCKKPGHEEAECFIKNPELKTCYRIECKGKPAHSVKSHATAAPEKRVHRSGAKCISGKGQAMRRN